VLDASRLARRRSDLDIDSRLREVDAAIAASAELKGLLGAISARTRTACDQARTVGQLDDCEERVTALFQMYLKSQ
jgi:hypothetical protein